MGPNCVLISQTQVRGFDAKLDSATLRFNIKA